MSLVAWYPLIDGSLENKGLDTTPLTLYGTVPFTNGRVRTAPTFSANANNYYTMPPITKVNDFSICCWVKCSSTANGWIVWQGVIGSINLGFSIISSGKLQYVCSPKIIVTDLPLNTWVHMCMTIDDNGYMNCYLNGENVGSASTNGFNYTEGDDLYIGLAKNVYPLNGQLQDFRYYDHCLSPKEVKEIAKGLCLHLPLKGTNARPNLFKNSATMFNTVGAIPISTTCTSSPALVFDENAPCGVNGKILRATVNRPDNTVSSVGGYYYYTATGIPTLTIGQKYCISVWARCTANSVLLDLGSLMEGHTFVKGSANRTLTSEWKRYYAIFIAKKTTSTTCFYISAPIGASGTLEYCCPKLELLSPTPYIPNVDDTQYSDYVLDYEPDCSGNEFDATKYGDLTTSDSNGRYNTAVAFNGTNTYLQGLAPTNSECKEFTIATWVKLNNNNTLNPAIYNCRTVSRHGINLIYRGNSSPTGILLDDGIANDVFPNSTLELDTWYHIAVTRDTTERKLYINGEFISSGVTTGNLADMSTKYTVGNIVTGTSIDNNYLKGSLSDFRLYTSVLSAEDVKELYETSVSIAHNPPSLTESAYYNYVEGQKHSTFDKSKFTIVGSPTITDDGIASGFSSSNYVTSNVPFTMNDSTKKYVYKGRITIGNDITTDYQAIFNIGGSTAFFFVLRANNLRCLNGGGNYCSNYFIVNANTTYDFILEYKVGIGGQLFVKELSATSYTDTGLYPQTSWTGTTATNIHFGYGEYQQPFNGSIDLKQFSITVDGKEVFSGNKTGVDQIKKDDYTVNGNPTISTDGIMTSADSTNYITSTNAIDLASANTWDIICSVKPKTSTLSKACTLAWSSNNSLVYQLRTDLKPYIFWNIGGSNVSFAANKAVEVNKKTYLKLHFEGTTMSLLSSLDKAIWTLIGSSTSSSHITTNNILRIGAGFRDNAITQGELEFDLNDYEIYVDGNLVYQPCLKIPYTESKTGIKVVDSTYLDRVKDVYDQHYLERYYTADETTQTVYEYPLFRDSMHSYEFDEGIQASITKNGIHNATTLTEATKTSMYQNNTDTVDLIEI